MGRLHAAYGRPGLAQRLRGDGLGRLPCREEQWAATYEVRNLRSNLCLQPKDGATQAGKRAEQAECNGRLVQEWNLPYLGNNVRHIVPAKNWNLGVTLENPAWTGSFLKLGYRNTADPNLRWNFEAR
ncbi:RICIN domain-containing protein [Allosalinactinospora lopnorensis]|uniref:RICIN domain-containing protein n=1 Tax=Allosalinactinospora lopnorensis TaxID=1352348 RepID=UPI001F339DD0|nr:RICIN domain-containing protein [Allosalinactinospora lopnorensis]